MPLLNLLGRPTLICAARPTPLSLAKSISGAERYYFCGRSHFSRPRQPQNLRHGARVRATRDECRDPLGERRETLCLRRTTPTFSPTEGFDTAELKVASALLDELD
jgi:hypothetical protein